MSEKKTRYNELLGVPNHIKDPDLYQLLGVERDTFDPNALEELYRDRMGTLQKIRSPKHKSFIEFLKGELRNARTTLSNAAKRQEYDQELFLERREQLQLILDVVLANNVLSPAEEERIFATGVDVGLTQAEVQQLVEEELAKRGAHRGAGVDQAAPPPAAAPPAAAPPPAGLHAAPPAQTLPQTAPPPQQPDAGAPLGVLQALGLGGPMAPPPQQQSYGTPLPPPGQLAPPGGGFMPPPLAPSIYAPQQPQGGFMPPPLAPSIHAPGGGMPGLAPSIYQQPQPQRVVVGVCTACMAPVHEDEVQQRKAEQFPDGRIHCAQCVTRLVAGLTCAVCYGPVTRAEKKQNEVVVAMIKAQNQKRAIHTRCLPQGARPKQPPQQAQRPTQGSGGWGSQSSGSARTASQSSGRLPGQAPAKRAPAPGAAPAQGQAPAKKAPAPAKPASDDEGKKKFKAPAPRKKKSWHKDS